MNELLNMLLSSPESIQEIVAQYKPMFYALCNEFFKVYKDLVNNDDYFATSAQQNWKMFRAYVDAGFTHDEAFTLLMRDIDSWQKSAQRVSTSARRGLKGE